MKKLLTIISAIALPTAVSAQNFEFLYDTASVYTSGYDEDFIAIENSLQNTSTESFTFDWRMLNPEVELPEGWGYNGFCDNTTCYTPSSSPNPFSGATLTSLPVEGRGVSPFKLQMDIPMSSADGLLIFEFEAKTSVHTDTAYFLVQKTPTGISTASIVDNKMKVYPNPSSTQVQIQIDELANVSDIYLYDLSGRRLLSMPVAAGTTTLDISALAAGQYVLQAVNGEGRILGLSRLVKQ